MPDLSALKLCLSQLTGSVVSTPRVRADEGPASMSGSGVSMSQRSAYSSINEKPFLDSPPDPGPTSPPTSSRQHSVTSLHPLEDEADIPLSFRQPHDSLNTQPSPKASNEEQMESVETDRSPRSSFPSPFPTVGHPLITRASRSSTFTRSYGSSPVHSFVDQPPSHRNPHFFDSLQTLPFLSPSSSRPQLFAALLTSRDLRHAFLTTRKLRRDRRSGSPHSQSLDLSSTTQLRVLRSLIHRCADTHSAEQRQRQRHATRLRYAKMLEEGEVNGEVVFVYPRQALHTIRRESHFSSTFITSGEEEESMAPLTPPPPLSVTEEMTESTPPQVAVAVDAVAVGGTGKSRVRQLILQKAKLDGQAQQKEQQHQAKEDQVAVEALEDVVAEADPSQATDEAMALQAKRECEREDMEAEQSEVTADRIGEELESTGEGEEESSRVVESEFRDEGEDTSPLERAETTLERVQRNGEEEMRRKEASEKVVEFHRELLSELKERLRLDREAREALRRQHEAEDRQWKAEAQAEELSEAEEGPDPIDDAVSEGDERHRGVVVDTEPEMQLIHAQPEEEEATPAAAVADHRRHSSLEEHRRSLLNADTFTQGLAPVVEDAPLASEAEAEVASASTPPLDNSRSPSGAEVSSYRLSKSIHSPSPLSTPTRKSSVLPREQVRPHPLTPERHLTPPHPLAALHRGGATGRRGHPNPLPQSAVACPVPYPPSCPPSCPGPPSTCFPQAPCSCRQLDHRQGQGRSV